MCYVNPVSSYQVVLRNTDDIVVNVVMQPGFCYAGKVQICICYSIRDLIQFGGQRQYGRQLNRQKVDLPRSLLVLL